MSPKRPPPKPKYNPKSDEGHAKAICEALGKHVKGVVLNFNTGGLLAYKNAHDMRGQIDFENLEKNADLLIDILTACGPHPWQTSVEQGISMFLNANDQKDIDEKAVCKEAYKLRTMVSHCLRSHRQPSNPIPLSSPSPFLSFPPQSIKQEAPNKKH